MAKSIMEYRSPEYLSPAESRCGSMTRADKEEFVKRFSGLVGRILAKTEEIDGTVVPTLQKAADDLIAEIGFQEITKASVIVEISSIGGISIRLSLLDTQKYREFRYKGQ